MAFAADEPEVTARLGISAGEAIADLALGTSDEALRMQIPLLWTTAAQLGVSIESASVGQGFWSDDGQLASENDLDLVVTGRRDAIAALADILGRAWGQRTVFIWHPATAPGEGQATATIPLPGGATQLSDEIYQAIIGEITDGAHVRYAGADSLIFVAKTNDRESDEAFFARVMRLVGLLNATDVQAGPITPGQADFTLVELIRELEFAPSQPGAR
jgi:hypothetical protein